MSYDYTTQIKLTNLKTKLASADTQFLASLNSDDLKALQEQVAQLATNIRIELNSSGKG